VNEVLVAFDVDGSLRDNTTDPTRAPVAKEQIRSLLVILSRFSNVTIMVWSGGGEQYARHVATYLGLESYVDRYADKHYYIPIPGCPGGNSAGGNCIDPLHHRHFASDIKPDIAIDDMTTFNLGAINLIVGPNLTNPIPRQIARAGDDLSWLADLRAVLYPVIFEVEPTNGIDRVLTRIVGNDTERYRRLITAALASNLLLSDALDDCHPEEVVRRFLRELLRRISG
jgi:hypothetical protein